MIDIDIGNRR